jgi:hypothetical protein
MGYGAWVNLIQRAEPHRGGGVLQGVAVQVAFTSKTFETGFSLHMFNA